LAQANGLARAGHIAVFQHGVKGQQQVQIHGCNIHQENSTYSSHCLDEFSRTP
jgi:hypothetical protein